MDNKLYHSLKRNKKSVITYSPVRGWANDPCGLIRVNNIYHLFYQYCPMKNPEYLNWGHAISEDLVKWIEIGVAIPFDKNTFEDIYSGTVVYDENNSSKLGRGQDGPLVAFYTSHYHSLEKESQSIAFSNNKGETWNKYTDNPVITKPPNGYKSEQDNFRDPKVFWFPQEKQWVMVVALSAKQIALFYKSDNLINWNLLSQFESTIAFPNHVWECPDLFKLEVTETHESKWVLLLSVRPHNFESQYPRFVRYFIGNFDGTTFTEDDSKSNTVNRLDYGSDFFAGQTWNNVDNKIYLTGWVNNWGYATFITDKYRGGLSLVREVNIIKKGNDYKLIQKPIKAITENYTENRVTYEKEQVERGIEINGSKAYCINFNIKNNSIVDGFTIFIESGTQSEAGIHYKPDEKTLFIEKENMHIHHVGEYIINSAKLDGGTEMNFQIFIDHMLFIIFCNNGEVVFTELLLSNSAMRTFKLVRDSSASLNDASVEVLLLKDLEF